VNTLSTIVTTAVVSALGLAFSAALTVQGEPNIPISVIPTINLTAVIIGSVSMGMLLNRVRQLERRMDKVQRKVFNEEEDRRKGER